MKNLENKTPELLAPAGNLACALAAFDAGADAVYGGLKKFNARERTENFSEEELGKLLAYAKKYSKKVYITFNTLVKESEIEDAARALETLEELHPDALIVQDLGIMTMIRDWFPNLIFHASTQAGFHNSAGLKFAASLGAKRVIMERQTSLRELEQMMFNNPPCEVEVFIHGALCCCISGSCLLSSWLGGWSGNRGKCKQPCRRRYHGSDGNGFFLSSQDLCTIELLPQIIRTGVASLKIEGRLRRADYVANAVSAYRMALDAEDEDDFKRILPEAKERLTKTFGRKWSLGFYTAESAHGLIKHDSLGASGLLCGKVLSASGSGFKVEVSKRLHLGDTIRVQPRSGDEGPAFSITKMSIDGESVRRALQGQVCFIHSDKEVTAGALVYKTGESCGDFSKRIDSLPLPKPSLPVDVKVSSSGFLFEAAGHKWDYPLEIAAAKAHPLQPETVSAEFQELASDLFAFAPVRAQTADGLFLPASVFKTVKKAFRDHVETVIDPAVVTELPKRHLQDFLKFYRSSGKEPDRKQFPDTVILPRGVRNPNKDWSVAREWDADPSPHEEFTFPFFIPETKLSEVKKSLDEFVRKGGKTVRITSLHHLELLKPYPNLIIRTNHPLPVCNSIVSLELKRLGVSGVQAWLELEEKELELLAGKSALHLELYRFGRPVLLTTRADVPAHGSISDARGNTFRITKHGILTQLTAEKSMRIPMVKGMDSCLYDLRNADFSDRDNATFNFNYSLL